MRRIKELERQLARLYCIFFSAYIHGDGLIWGGIIKKQRSFSRLTNIICSDLGRLSSGNDAAKYFSRLSKNCVLDYINLFKIITWFVKYFRMWNYRPRLFEQMEQCSMEIKEEIVRVKFLNCYKSKTK